MIVAERLCNQSNANDTEVPAKRWAASPGTPKTTCSSQLYLKPVMRWARRLHFQLN